MFESQRKVLFNSPHSLVYSRKLDTALRDTTVKSYIVRFDKDIQKYNDKLFSASLKLHTGIEEPYHIRKNFHIWPYMCKSLLSINRVCDGETMKSSRKIPEIIRKALEFQLNYNLDNYNLSDKNDVLTKTKEWLKKTYNIPKFMNNLLYAEKSMSRLVELLPRVESYSSLSAEEKLKELPKHLVYDDDRLDFKCVFGKEICYVAYNGFETLLPTSYILLIHNKIADLISILTLCHYLNDATYEEDAYDKSIMFLQDTASIVSGLQNKGYDMMKCLESIGIGMSLIDVDGESNSEFLNTLILNLERNIEMTVTNCEFYKIMKTSSIAFRHELMCLSKVLGHPFVSMEEGTSVLFNRVQEELDIDPGYVTRSVWYAKKSYVKNHILKNGVWPECIIEDETLKRYKRKNRDPDDLKYHSTLGIPTLEAFDTLKLCKARKFVELENVIPHLKDKTISILRSEVIHRYFSSQKMTEKVKWENTRLLLYYLLKTTAETSHQGLLEKWCLDPDTDINEVLDYLVIRIVPKEKELKTVYRGFGCRPMQTRMITLAQEITAAHVLDEVCPEQAMTLDELGILRKLLGFRRIERAYKGYKPIYCVIDATAWNSYHRHTAMAPVLGETLDAIHGSVAFSRTQLSYENTLYYVPDELGFYRWEGQLGGIEGQNQYSWDWGYIAQVKVAIENIGYHSICFVKGDDLRVVVMVPPQVLEVEKLSDVQKYVVNTIESSLSKFGHKIKLEDSYGSTSYFAFSKAASIGLIELPQTFRKIQKCHGANNAFLPFIDDYIANSFSNAHSACKAGVNTIGPYVVAIFWSVHHMLNHQSYKDLSDDSYLALLFVPSLLGGFPVISFHNMWIRAESDLLSPFIHLCHYAKKAYPNLYAKMSNFFKIMRIEPDNAFRGLLADPYSLPIRKPIQATTRLYNKVRPALQRIVKNEDIRELIEASDSQAMKDFVKCLQTCSRYDAKVLGALYAASPEGLLMELMRKFETGRSILTVLILRYRRRTAHKILLDVIESDKRVHKHRISVLEGQNRYDTDLTEIVEGYTCPEECAKKIRDKLWGKSVEGISMPPVQHQVYLIDDHTATDSAYENTNKFTYTIKKSNMQLDDYRLPLYSSGPYKPFIGYKTRNGLQTPVIQLIEKDAVLAKVQSLLDLISWCDVSEQTKDGLLVSNIKEAITYILSIYVDIPSESLEPFRGEKRSGTIMHHLHSPGFREEIVPNTLSNVYTHFKGTANTHIRLTESNLHYRINFLHVYCHVLFEKLLKYQLSNLDYIDDSTFYAISVDCKHCLEPIIERPIVCDLSLLGPLGPLKNKVSFLTVHGQQIIEKSLLDGKRKIQNCILPSSELKPAHAKMGMLQYLVTTRYFDKQALMAFAYGHQMSSEAQDIISTIYNAREPSTNVSKRELKSIELDLFIDALMIIVVDYFQESMPDHTAQDYASQLRIIPGNDIPWVGILNELLEINKLADFLTILQRRSELKMHNIQHNAATAAYYVGEAIYKIFLEGRCGSLTYVYLSSYKPQTMEKLFITMSDMLKNRFITDRYREFFKVMPSRAFDRHLEELTLDVLSCVIVILECPCSDIEHIAAWSEEVPINSTTDVRILDVGEFNVYALECLSSNTVRYIHYLISMFSEVAVYKLQEWFRMVQVVTSETSKYYLNHAKNVLMEGVSYQDIVVVYSDLTSCINVVRSQQVIKPTKHIKRKSLEGDPIMEINPVSLSSSVIIPYEESGTRTMTALPQCYSEKVRDEFMMRPFMFFRSFGYGTSAPSKLYELFDVTNMYLPSNSTMAFLGDGDGGFLVACAELTKNCNLIFNTLMDEPESFPTPVVYGDVVSKNEHSIIQNSIYHCATDLSKKETLISIENNECHNLLTSLVTCDAQTVKMDMYLREKLVKNVCIFYLRNRTSTGALILKVYMNEQNITLRAIKLLSTYCNKVVLIKPPASGMNVEWYIVAQGTLRNFNQDYLADMGYFPSHKISTEIVMATNRIMERKDEFFDGDTSYKLHEWSCGWKRTICTHKMESSNGISYLNSRTGVSIEPHLLSCPDEEQPNIYRCLRTFTSVSNASLGTAVNCYMENLRALEGQNVSTERWDTKTLSHKLAVVKSFMTCAGAIACLNHPKTRNSMVSENEVRGDYERILTVLPCKNVVEKLRRNYKRDCTVYGIKSQPYEDFLVGYHAILQCYGYIDKITGFVSEENDKNDNEDEEAFNDEFEDADY